MCQGAMAAGPSLDEKRTRGVHPFLPSRHFCRPVHGTWETVEHTPTACFAWLLSTCEASGWLCNCGEATGLGRPSSWVYSARRLRLTPFALSPSGLHVDMIEKAMACYRRPKEPRNVLLNAREVVSSIGQHARRLQRAARHWTSRDACTLAALNRDRPSPAVSGWHPMLPRGNRSTVPSPMNQCKARVTVTDTLGLARIKMAGRHARSVPRLASSR